MTTVRRGWRDLARDPLTVFFGLAAISIAVSAQLGTAAQRGVVNLNSAAVEATERRLSQQLRRPPTEVELRASLQTLADHEILYREAVALGLDRADPIVRRRMIQKMTMILEGRYVERDGDDAALSRWFDQHGVRFEIPERRSFVHMQLGHVSEAELAVLVREASALGPEEVAQGMRAAGASIHGPHQRALDLEEVRGRFGAAVADEVFDLDPGTWSAVAGPHGWVLVRVDEIIAARVPSLDEVRGQAREGWRAQQREKSAARGLEELRNRYEVRGMP